MINLEKSWKIFRFLIETEKNHEQILFNLTKLIYTHASGHVNFWDFKLVFFIISSRLRALKTLYFYYEKMKENKLKWNDLMQRILQEIMKKNHT